MIHINEIPLDFEPRKKILPKLRDCPKGYRNPEMSEFDSAFLCGLLKIHRPKKILEVGVANGATTAIILQTLEDIGEPYEMYSVDLSENWYRDKTKSTATGFLATFAKENNLFNTPPQLALCGKHKFYLGKFLPQSIDEIGGDIDFVVLDTTHQLPGEVLDFPVALPYLKDGAIVIVHDVALNHYTQSPRGINQYATTVLLSTVTAKEKFLNLEPADENHPVCYPNIAAFKIDNNTRLHIENVFLGLIITWRYLLNDEAVEIYRDFYRRHYPADLLEIFNEAVRLNTNTHNKFK